MRLGIEQVQSNREAMGYLVMTVGRKGHGTKELVGMILRLPRVKQPEIFYTGRLLTSHADVWFFI